MSPARSQVAARPETVALTRKQISAILVDDMGWEPIDVRVFWRLARKLQPAGGQ